MKNFVTSPELLQVGKALGAMTEGIAILVTLCGAAYFAKQQRGLMKGLIIGRGYEILIMVVITFVVSNGRTGDERYPISEMLTY